MRARTRTIVIAFMALFAATTRAVEFQPTAQVEFVDPAAKPELLWNEGVFTEGPVAAPDGNILFSDIGNRILKFDPKTRKVTVLREPSGKANGLAYDAFGRLLGCEGAGQGGGRRVSITETDGRVHTLAARYDGKGFNSPNDLDVAPSGRVYFTDPRYLGSEPREIDFEGVFFIEPSGSVRLATRELQKPNGIAISRDGAHAYVADSNSDPFGNHQLVRFDIRPEGTLASKRVLYDFGPRRRGVDGMTLDRDGNIYATAGTGERAGVYLFSPDGKPLALIPMPGDPTNCAFGRGADARTLYITAAGPGDWNKSKRPYGLYRITLRKAG